MRSFTVTLDPHMRQFHVTRQNEDGVVFQRDTLSRWTTIHAVLEDLDEWLSNGDFDYRRTCLHCDGKGFVE